MRTTIRWTASCLLALALGIEAAPAPAPAAAKRSVKATTWKPTAFAPASPNKVVSSNVLELKKTNLGKGNSRSAGALLTSGSGTLLSLFEGEEYATSITFGTQTFDVIVDTGSSDTWLVESGFKCLDISTNTQVAASECEFGPTYTVDSTFKQIAGEEFSITYGDGEFLTGIFGTELVTLAGIQVNQTVALVNSAGWVGDGTTSGLTGLAYPAITSAYSSSTSNQIVYNPIFTTMYEDGLIDPLFSLAILRNVSGPAGYLTLGGLPPLNFTQNFTATPILVTSISGYPKNYDFYSINIDGISLSGKSVTNGAGGSSIQYIVDSGTTLNYYPTKIANQVNAAFNPAATYSSADGAYIVDCNATPPAHGITINGTTFFINPLDMILEAGTDSSGNTICISGIDDGGSNASQDVYILGDTFQKNVITVFDVGAGELRFAAREDYPSNDSY